MAVTMDDVTQFYKLISQWGSIARVDDDLRIINIGDDTPIVVEINKQPRELVVLHNNATMKENQTAFNPLLETVGHSSERKWFFTSINIAIGAILAETILRIAEIVTAEETNEPSYDEMELCSPYNKLIDDRIHKDFKNIDSSKLLRLVYNRRKRTAQLQTAIYDDEFLKKEWKFSVKGIKTLRMIVADLMQSEKIHSDYIYSAKAMDMPEIECVLNIMSLYSKSMGKYAKIFLNVELFSDELEAHIELITSYRKKCSWAASGVADHDRNKKIKKDNSNTTLSGLPQIKIGGSIPSGSFIKSSIPSTGSFLRQRIMQNQNTYLGMPNIQFGGMNNNSNIGLPITPSNNNDRIIKIGRGENKMYPRKKFGNIPQVK